MIYLKKFQGNQLWGLLSPLMRIGSHGAVIWVQDSFTVEASTESVTVQLRFESLCFDHYVCSESTRTWLNLHHLDGIFSSTAGNESLIMSAVTSDNARDTNAIFVYERHGTYLFTAETYLRGCAIPHHHRHINESELRYHVAVGIQSEEFRRIIGHFDYPWTEFVEARVTGGQVRFCSDFFEDIVLTTESGGCDILWRYGNEGQCVIRIHMLDRVALYSETSWHSDRVWLLHSEVNSPEMMLFVVREFIYFMFYMNG